MSNALILYYSFEGHTETVAEYLSKELDIPCERVRPINDLKSIGFSKYPIGGSQVVLKRKPEIIPIKVNIEQYDTILIASPIWAGSFAPAIRTLLETGILKGKKIGFFYTHDGGPGKAETKIQASVNINNILVSSYGLARVKDGFEPLKPGVLDWARGVLDK